ncbi:MAG: hypothetical protein AAB883_01640 [Patescibacteria group bacterium]
MTPQKIGPMTLGLMAGLALVLDVIQFFLTLTVIGSFVSMFVAMLAWIVFFIWFALLGVSYFDAKGGKKLAIAGVSFISELIPFIDALPGLTIGVIMLVLQHNKEVDEMAAKKGTALVPTGKDAQVANLANIRARRAEKAQAANDNAESEREAA